MNDATMTPDDIFHELVKQISNQTLHLASLPDIIVKVNQVLSDEQKGIKDVAKVIQGEIALSARILQIANSAAFKRNQQVESVTDAINRLGINLVKNIAISVSLRDRFDTKNLDHKKLMQQIMSSSIKQSVIGMLISKHLILTSSPELLLISGLMSNIGHTVIVKYADENVNLTAVEMDSLLTKYGDEIGELILRLWDFPTSIIEALFSRSIPNIVAPVSNHDVMSLTKAYISYLDGNHSELPIFWQITSLIAEHSSEYESLKLLLS